MGWRDERRSLPRRRTRISAKIIHGDTSIVCTIRDESEHGARLLLPAGAVLPNKFQLLRLSTEMTQDAEIVWRNNHECGVVFRSARRRSSAA